MEGIQQLWLVMVSCSSSVDGGRKKSHSEGEGREVDAWGWG